MPRAKKVKTVTETLMNAHDKHFVKPEIDTTTMKMVVDFQKMVEEQPKRTMRLLSWDKATHAGMLHIADNGKSAVYCVRSIDSLNRTIVFQKVQPTSEGVNLNLPYTVHVWIDGDGYKGVCHCQGYKNRKECRHVDAAITMIEEYSV